MSAKIKLLLICLVVASACSRQIESPTVKNNFERPASSEEVLKLSKKLASNYDFLSYEIIGKSPEGKEIIAVKASKSNSDNNLRILIFGQQHGNEQSSKECLLLLIRDMHRYQNWLDFAEIWIVPQVNPEGADINERRNSNGIDLNRDHVVLDAPETQALQLLFQRTLPHVTIDIHEYYPYRESWEDFGGFKNFDVQVGVPTNINVDERIREFATYEALPVIERHLNEKGFSFHNYLVGPVPTKGRTRHSTVDVNDGRQSFAIRNTLSFIYEGINGKDGYVESLERRTYGQYEAVVALLSLLVDRSEEVVSIVEQSRSNLINAQKGEEVVIRMDHFGDGNDLFLPLTSSTTGLDTIVVVDNFHPIVKPLLKVERPEAYLVPASDSLLFGILIKHNVEYEIYNNESADNVYGYYIETIEEVKIEELENRLPELRKDRIIQLDEEYLIVPTAQLHSNFIVLIFEPQSMLGLAQREGFEYLLKEDITYPIFRVE